MVKRHPNPDKKMFLETIQDIRKLVGQHRGNYTKDTMGLNKSNTKVPFTHLQGRRQKLHSRHQKEKARANEEAIQYDSSMKLLNSNVMETKREKDQFEKNNYKFEKVNSGRVGREKDGFLYLNKKDIDRIHGKLDGEKKKIKKEDGGKGAKRFNKHKKPKKGKGKKGR
jgi:hypothetical protein